MISFLLASKANVPLLDKELEQWIKHSSYIQTLTECNDLSDCQVDVSWCSLITFSIVHQHILSGTLPIIPSWVNLTELKYLISYLDIHDMEHWLKIPMDKDFYSLLSSTDKALLKDEVSLRNKLFNDEQTDYRDNDVDYLFELQLANSHYNMDNSIPYPTIKHGSKELGSGSMSSMSSMSSRMSREMDKTVLHALEDWSDLLLAGGKCTEFSTNSELAKCWNGHDIGDFDMLLTTKDETKAKEAIVRVYKALTKVSKNVYIIRSEHALNFITKELVIVQIVLRLYNSVAQVLSGFDLDSCCVGWDGTNMYCMPRFLRSVFLGYNLVDQERQSVNYGIRLAKYNARYGFKIAVPGLILEHSIKPTSKSTGLSRVLYQASFPNSRTSDSDYGFVMDYNSDINPRSSPSDKLTESQKQEQLNRIAWEILIGQYNDTYNRRLFLTRKGTLKIRGYPVLDDFLNQVDTPIIPSMPDAKLQCNLPAIWSFRTENPAGQNTGSFCRTNEPWFRDLYQVHA